MFQTFFWGGIYTLEDSKIISALFSPGHPSCWQRGPVSCRSLRGSAVADPKVWRMSTLCRPRGRETGSGLCGRRVLAASEMPSRHLCRRGISHLKSLIHWCFVVKINKRLLLQPQEETCSHIGETRLERLFIAQASCHFLKNRMMFTMVVKVKKTLMFLLSLLLQT